MIDAWFNNENTDWMVGTDDARDIWCTLIEYLSSRTHEQRRADEGDPIKNWYLDIWNIVDKGETTPPPDFDTIVDIIYSDVFNRNITEDTFASIFNIAPVPLQYCFIDFISSDNQLHQHYAGETYGNYDSDYEPEEIPGRIFDWSNEEVSAVGGGQGVIDLTGDETKTDSAIDSMPELVSASDTESDLDGYETEATVIVDNDNCEEVVAPGFPDTLAGIVHFDNTCGNTDGVNPVGTPITSDDQCDDCGKPINAAELIDPKCRHCGNTPQFKDSEHFFLSSLPLRINS